MHGSFSSQVLMKSLGKKRCEWGEQFRERIQNLTQCGNTSPALHTIARTTHVPRGEVVDKFPNRTRGFCNFILLELSRCFVNKFIELGEDPSIQHMPAYSKIGR